MSATLAPAGSVSCQCVMSPDEGELPVPLCPVLSALMSFWINQCWFPPPLSPGPPSIPFQLQILTYSPPLPCLFELVPITWPCHPIPHNEPSRQPYIPLQHSLSTNCEYLFVGQSAFPTSEDFDVQISWCVIVTVAAAWSCLENWARFSSSLQLLSVSSSLRVLGL